MGDFVQMVNIAPYRTFGIKLKEGIKDFVWTKDLTEESSIQSHWEIIHPEEARPILHPKIIVDQLVLTGGGLSLEPLTELVREARSDFFSKSWRLTIGYCRIEVEIKNGEDPETNPKKRRKVLEVKVYNLVLRWCPGHCDDNTYLCLEERKGKKSCFTKHTWQRNEENQVDFLAENNLFKNLVSIGHQKDNKRNIWNGRFKAVFTKNTGWARSKPTAALIPYITSVNLLDNNKDLRGSKTLDRYRSKPGITKCRVLPHSPMSSNNIDIDVFRDQKEIEGYFGKEIAAEELTAAIGALESLVDETVQCQDGGKLNQEDRNLLLGALADRFYSHQGWRLKPYEPIPGAVFDKSSIHLDIDQVSLEIDDMESCKQMQTFWKSWQTLIVPTLRNEYLKNQLIPFIQSTKAKSISEADSFIAFTTVLEAKYLERREKEISFDLVRAALLLEMAKGRAELEILISEIQLDNTPMTEAESWAEMERIAFDCDRLKLKVELIKEEDPRFKGRKLTQTVYYCAMFIAYSLQFFVLNMRMDAGIARWMLQGEMLEKNQTDEKRQQAEIFNKYTTNKNLQSESLISKVQESMPEFKTAVTAADTLTTVLTTLIETIREETQLKFQRFGNIPETAVAEPTVHKVEAQLEGLMTAFHLADTVLQKTFILSSPIWGFHRYVKPICEIDYAWKRVNKIPPLTLFGCIQSIDEELKATIFHGDSGDHLLTLNYLAITNHMRFGKGGHSYMTCKERGEYYPVYSPSQADVLKLSVAFRKASQSSTPSFNDNGIVEAFLTPRYKRIERYLRENHFQKASNKNRKEKESEEKCENGKDEDGFQKDGKENWKDKDPEHKVIIAYYLTCEYLSECDYHQQDMLGFENLFLATTEASIKIRNGFRFPYIFPYMLSMLESVLGDSSIMLDFVYETYGTKCRASTQLTDFSNLKTAAHTLFERNKRLTTDSIWRFATFCKNDTVPCKLIVGYGCNFSATDASGKLQYPVIDSLQLRKNLKEGDPASSRPALCQQNKSYLSPKRLPDPTEPLVPDDPAAIPDTADVIGTNRLQSEPPRMVELRDGDGDDNGMEADKGNVQEDPEWDKDPYRDSFTVLGHTLPAALQPITVVVGDQRFQTYSVLLRHASGEDGQREPASKLASDMSLYLHSPGDGECMNMQAYQVAHHHKNVAKWSTLVSSNCKNLEKVGNICRLEVAIPVQQFSTVKDLYDSVRNGVEKTWDYCQKYMKLYSVDNVAQISNFFSKALAFRVNLAKMITQKDRSDFSSADMAILNVLSETNAYIKHFYSGRKSGGDFNISGKHLGKRYNRPILRTISSGLSATLKKVGIENLDALWTKFLERMGTTLDDRFKCFQLKSKEYYATNVPKKVVCLHCMRILDKGHDAQDHPCIRGEHKVELREFTCPSIQQKIQSRREGLSSAQRRVVDEILNSREDETFHHNSLITGVAGSGKSTTAGVLLLEYLRRAEGRAVVGVVSPTKNAAGVLYGETVNSYFHFGIEDYNQDHNFMSLYIRKYKELKMDQEFKRKMDILEVLFLDECSLVTALGLRNIDRMLQLIKGCDKPFGGVQVILIGDPLQLPPVINDKQMRKESKSAAKKTHYWEDKWKFFFQSPSFCFGLFRVYSLIESHRQKDPKFVEVLNRVRDGTIMNPEHRDTDLEYINSWGSNVDKEIVLKVYKAAKQFHLNRKSNSVREVSDKRFSGQVTDLDEHYKHLNTKGGCADMMKSFVICAENEEAAAISSAFDEEAHATNTIYRSESVDVYYAQGQKDVDLFPAEFARYYQRDMKSIQREINKLTKRESTLNLFLGKIVKFASNNINKFVANNMLGKITSITKDPNDETRILEVKIQPIPQNWKLVAKEVVVTPRDESWYIAKRKGAPESKFILVNKGSKLSPLEWDTWELVRTQFPLCSANAGTIYIFQGTTCPPDSKVIVCPQYFQHCGSAYTALSRAQSVDQLFLLFPLVANDILVNHVAQEFDRHHRPQVTDGGLLISGVDYYYKGEERVSQIEMGA